MLRQQRHVLSGKYMAEARQGFAGTRLVAAADRTLRSEPNAPADNEVYRIATDREQVGLLPQANIIARAASRHGDGA